MKAAKPQRSSSESAHCHFHHILLINSRHKASPDSEAWGIDLISSWEELQSDAVIFAVCRGPHVLPQGPLEKLSHAVQVGKVEGRQQLTEGPVTDPAEEGEGPPEAREEAQLKNAHVVTPP